MSNIEYIPPIKQSDIDLLSSDDISKKNYDQIIKSIDDRFGYVFLKFMEIVGRTVDWFDFDNEGGEYTRGYFDPNEYKDEIMITGSYDHDHKSINSFYDSDAIPTKWLTYDFEEELLADFSKHQANEKVLNEEKIKINRLKKSEWDSDTAKTKKMKELIKSKLTSEELKYVKFVEPVVAKNTSKSTKNKM